MEILQTHNRCELTAPRRNNHHTKGSSRQRTGEAVQIRGGLAMSAMNIGGRIDNTTVFIDFKMHVGAR